MKKIQLPDYLIAAVWLGNGLFCKVLNLVPRHQEIVARILGERFARPLTLLIGLAEIVMFIWILSGIYKRINALTQIFIIALMNIIEISLASDLLLFGKLNFVVAVLFMLVIYFNEFGFGRKSA